jgi:dienelactone hydrolase
MKTHLVIISFYFGLLFTCSNLLAQESGPSFIQHKLINNAVFEIPTYDLTTDYDDFKEFDNMKGLFIDGLDYEGHPTKVFCWYGVPETLQPNEKAPAVVLVHGGGGTAFPDWVKQWTKRGYIAIAIAHEGQIPGEKVDGWWQTWEFSGPRRPGFFNDVYKKVEEQWFYNAVADAMMANSLLRSFPEVDTTNIGINGISWGGILTNVITGIDHRFKFSIPVYGCGYLYDSPKYRVDLSNLSAVNQQFFLDNWEPSLYIPLQELPVFFLDGTNDKQFAMNIATRSYKSIPNEKYLRIEHMMRHSTINGYAPEEIYHFADYITQNGPAPITVSIDTLKDDSSIVASYDGTIKSATLYYTTDTFTWISDEYEWQEIDARVRATDSKIIVDLPENAICFFINVISTDDLMYSSPMEKVFRLPATQDKIKATANTDYGIDQVATLISELQTAPDNLATFRLSCDVTPSSGEGIMSGPGGGVSVATDWGVANSSDTTDIQNVIFKGSDDEWVVLSNIQIVDFKANGGELTADDFTDLSFQSVTIINAQSGSRDAVALIINGETTNLGAGDITEVHEIIDLQKLSANAPITTFDLGIGESPDQATNKWSVEDITVEFAFDHVTANIQLSYEDEAPLIIQPNPASHHFALNVVAESTHVFNLAGQCVKQFPAGVQSFDISSLKAGIYLVKVR